MVEILEEIRKRRSGRVFDTRPVPQEMLDSIIEAGRWAPSCMNAQEWNFVILKDRDILEKAHEALTRGNAYGKRAPIMLLVVTTEGGGCESHNLPYWMMSVGLTTENILLQAVHIGLLAHPIAGWNEEKLIALLGIPDGYRIATVIFIGFEGNIEDVDEVIQEKEKRPRTRKPLEDILHINGW